MRKLYYGDNLEILRSGKIAPESVDLCYIDPPFNSKRNYNQIYNNPGKEDRAQAFIDTWTWDTRATEGLNEIYSNSHGVFTRQTIELIRGLSMVLGKGALLAYLISMTLRITEIWHVLKPTGSFYLHCDPTASHYLKLIVDAIFCSQGGEFINEIIWCYGSGGASKHHFSKKHDVILFYGKSDTWTFNVDEVREPYSSPHKSMTPKVVGDKTYLKMNPLGRIPFDWWQIAILTNSAKERLRYPTQKPEALLEKVITSSSNKGDLVLDAYCGCGTTVTVAERLNRNWIGIDITYQSISLILRRLEGAFKDKPEVLRGISLDGIPMDVESARALANKADDRLRKEFEKWSVLTYTDNRAVINEKKGGDKGIDGIAFIQETADDIARVIFSVKSGPIQPSMVRDLHGTVEREQAAMGILITLEQPSPGVIQTAKEAGFYQNPLMGKNFDKLQVVTIQDMLDGARLSLPMTHDVLNKAKSQARGAQKELGI